MLRAVLAVLDRHRGKTRAHRKAWRAGQHNWKDWYETGQPVQWNGEEVPVAETGMFAASLTTAFDLPTALQPAQKSQCRGV
jgi:hypothetical protein